LNSAVVAVTIVAELRSGRKVRFQALGTASQAEIEALAIQHAGGANDRVVSIVFDEEKEGTDGEAVEVIVQEAVTTASEPVAAWQPVPRSGMWNGEKPKTKRPPPKELQQEIERIRVQQLALEESKYAGRDIDEVDEEIRELEARKIQLKKLLPRKRFLWIF
jgi:flagellar motility protein MotE (MotC chaperone)